MPTGKEAQRIYRANNPGQSAQYAKEYRERTKNEMGNKWRKENKKHLKTSTYDWRRRNIAKVLLANMRNGANKRKQDCTLTEKDLEIMLEPMTCSVTNLPLIWEGPDRYNPWAPSPDRLDNSKGYIPGNVRIVCILYNRARNCYTDEEVLVMAKALTEKEKSIG